MQEVKTKKENDAFMHMWENNATPDSQDPITRVTAMLERAKVIDA